MLWRGSNIRVKVIGQYLDHSYSGAQFYPSCHQQTAYIRPSVVDDNLSQNVAFLFVHNTNREDWVGGVDLEQICDSKENLEDVSPQGFPKPDKTDCDTDQSETIWYTNAW